MKGRKGKSTVGKSQRRKGKSSVGKSQTKKGKSMATHHQGATTRNLGKTLPSIEEIDRRLVY